MVALVNMDGECGASLCVCRMMVQWDVWDKRSNGYTMIRDFPVPRAPKQMTVASSRASIVLCSRHDMQSDRDIHECQHIDDCVHGTVDSSRFHIKERFKS